MYEKSAPIQQQRTPSITEVKTNTETGQPSAMRPVHQLRSISTNSNSVVQLGKCFECGASKGHSEKYSKYKPPEGAKFYTEEELKKKAMDKQASMARTHHAKTGAPGTPASRQEEWKQGSVTDLYERMKESQDGRKKEGKK